MAKVDNSVRTVRPNDLVQALDLTFAIRKPTMIWGPPGIGKSQIVRQVADKISEEVGYDIEVFDIRLLLKEPTDLRGIPYRDPVSNTMVWAQPSDLPDPNDTTIVTVYDRSGAHPRKIGEKARNDCVSIVFFDELSAAPASIQAASYQIMLDRRIGTYELPDGAIIVGAGNRTTDNGVAFKMPKPLANRLCHVELEVNQEDWNYWAVANRVHPDVIGYVNHQKSKLFDFDPKRPDNAFPTPRSWASVSDLLKEADRSRVDTNIIGVVVAGCIGSGTATEFMGHLAVAKDMPKASDILSGKVKTLKNKEVSAQYALSAALCYELKDSYDVAKEKGKLDDWHKMADCFFNFMIDNFKREITVMSARTALRVYKISFNMQKLKSWKRFMKEFASLISDAV